jgi:hypothetical protein
VPDRVLSNVVVFLVVMLFLVMVFLVLSIGSQKKKIGSQKKKKIGAQKKKQLVLHFPFGSQKKKNWFWFLSCCSLSCCFLLAAPGRGFLYFKFKFVSDFFPSFQRPQPLRPKFQKKLQSRTKYRRFENPLFFLFRSSLVRRPFQS